MKAQSKRRRRHCAHPKRERLWLDGERCWCSRCGALKLATWHFPATRQEQDPETPR